MTLSLNYMILYKSECVLTFFFFFFAQAEEKYKVALQRYEDMRDELMHDLPALNNDRNTVLGFMLACVSITCPIRSVLRNLCVYVCACFRVRRAVLCGSCMSRGVVV